MSPGSAEADREISFGAGADLKAGVIGLASIGFLWRGVDDGVVAW
jgi:hypothetical protein